MGKSKKRKHSKEDKEEYYKSKILKFMEKLKDIAPESPEVPSISRVIDTNLGSLREEDPQDLSTENISDEDTDNQDDKENDEPVNTNNKGTATKESTLMTEENGQGKEMEGVEKPELDEEVLRALGVKTLEKSEELKLHPDLSTLLNNWLTNDHTKELEEDLMKKYPRLIEGCNVEAPKLNQEVQSSSPDSTIKRDKHFVTNQNIAGSALVALSSAVNILISKDEEIDRCELLEKLSDSMKMVAQLHYKFSQARRAYITPTMNKECRATLEDSVPDTLLYGDKLPEKIKSAKAVAKISEVLKTKTSNTKTVFKPLNWRGPPVRQTNQTQGGRKSVTSSKLTFRAGPGTSRYRTTSFQSTPSRNQERQQSRKQTSFHPSSNTRR